MDQSKQQQEKTAENLVTSKKIERVYTMPKEFVKHEKGTSWLLYVGIGGVGIALVAVVVAVLVALNGSQPAPVVVNQPTEQQPVDNITPPEDTTPNETQEPVDTQPEPEPELPPITASQLRPGRDSDNDGLTDLEENVFSTQLALPDTDGDGHSDSTEVLNLFNPIGTAPAFIVDSGLVRVYEDKGIGYQVYYPNRWTARSIDQSNTEIRFTSGSGEFIQLKIYENPENLPILQWYAQQNPTVDTSLIENVTSKSGLLGIKSIDGLTIYLVRPLRQTISGQDSNPIIFAFTYSPGVSTRYEYKTVFDMMLNSFELITQQSGVTEEESQPGI